MMDEERDILYFKMCLLQAEIEMNGMIAENKAREQGGRSIVYGKADFDSLIERYGIHHNAFPYHKD